MIMSSYFKRVENFFLDALTQLYDWYVANNSSICVRKGKTLLMRGSKEVIVLGAWHLVSSPLACYSCQSSFMSLSSQAPTKSAFGLMQSWCKAFLQHAEGRKKRKKQKAGAIRLRESWGKEIGRSKSNISWIDVIWCEECEREKRRRKRWWNKKERSFGHSTDSAVVNNCVSESKQKRKRKI